MSAKRIMRNLKIRSWYRAVHFL